MSGQKYQIGGVFCIHHSIIEPVGTEIDSPLGSFF